MPDSADEQWSRISAESELRPDRGVVDDVPAPLITPLPDDEPLGDPIKRDEVPPPSAADAPGSVMQSGTDAAPPIQVVPFQSGPLPEAGPDVIVAAPFELRVDEEPAVGEEPQEMITDVPVPHPDPVEVVADLPDVAAQPEKTPWWRLMLGGGESRAERRARTPEAAQPQPRPVPSEDVERDD